MALNRKSVLGKIVTVPVALIVIGAFVLSAVALVENLRFVKMTTDIFSFVDNVRAAASQQPSFATIAGEDLWEDLIHVGRLDKAVSRVNPWNGQMQASTAMTTANGTAMRIENDVPVHDCRRLALYFIGRQPLDLGLLSIEAQNVGDNQWTLIYPISTPIYERAAMFACGKGAYAHLALVFKIR